MIAGLLIGISRDEIKKLGVELHYANRGQAATNPDGQLLENIEAVIAEAERLRIKERTARGRAGKIASGKILGHGTAPLGYRFVGQKQDRALEVDEDEAQVVRLIFKWYTEGDDGLPLSTRQIADKLTAMRVPTWADRRGQHMGKKVGYGMWNDVVIIRILRKPTYAGTFEYWLKSDEGQKSRIPKGERLSVAVPAIVSRETWQLAQQRLDDGRKNSVRRGKQEYLIGRRFHCACGYAMVGSTKGRGSEETAYTCAGKRNRPPCQESISYHGGRTDAAVWAWLADKLHKFDFISASHERRITTPPPLDTGAALIEQQITHTQSQLDELATLRVAKQINAASYDKLFAELTAVLRRLEADQAAATTKVQDEERAEVMMAHAADVVASVRDKLDVLDYAMRRMLVDLFNVRAVTHMEGKRRGLKIESWLAREPEIIWVDAPAKPYYNN